MCIPLNCESTELLTSPLNWLLDRDMATAKIKVPSAQLTCRMATNVSSFTRAQVGSSWCSAGSEKDTHSQDSWL